MIMNPRFRSLGFFGCAALLSASRAPRIPRSPADGGAERTTRTLAAALTMLALTGCASWQELAANNCLYYGYRPGTDGFASCAQSEMMAMRAQYENAMDRLTAASAASQAQGSHQTPAPEY
jgi:hypothetical protein